MLDPQTLTLFGLALDMIGAMTVAAGALTSKGNALKEIQSSLGAWSDTTDDQIKEMDVYRNKIRASTLTIWGTVFLVFGFFLQAISVYLN